ncbi:hypothetical protein [Streptomyces resistomycificus]|uniref:Uncharacterized protein n=1 Tax=Streptomyces resistomycificus TaxID=67356 RepID=A0A0L8LVM4_9ACTN|nr:hypothetical protein [Streptomyces resistomycificus]KOG42196.1 hypothetical protein ADK37_05980 [Streptomyces resistomycificus]KUN92112.1 hypothetical protein AQJ84_34375 [Streptomyces resistomycificus]
MEQRIGSSSQPLEGAGFDPAFIPGLTSPGSGAKADDGPEDAKAEQDERVEEADDAEHTASGEAETSGEPSSAQPGGPEGADEADDEEAPDGPVFEASDRRARIVADHKGVRLALDDQQCEFRWDEIGAVETESPRFGKRFTITVHTPDRRWYPIEIEAASRAKFTEWDEQLDAVLDAYFEEGEEGDKAAEDDAA